MSNSLGASSVSPLGTPPLQVPIPGAYTRQVAYDSSKGRNQLNNTSAASDTYGFDIKRESIGSLFTETESIKSNEKESDDQDTGSRRKSLLIFLRDSRLYIRALAIMIMIVAFSLILAAIIKFEKAKNLPGHPLDSVPKPSSITDYPCRVFTGVAAMNLALSITIFSLSCVSSKFNKTNNAINAIFAILSAVGFASSMGACFFLNRETELQNDLWKWSCGNHNNGISSNALNFELVCEIVNYGWRFGLVQASLELLTFLISIVAFCILKYSLYVRYGAFGKVF